MWRGKTGKVVVNLANGLTTSASIAVTPSVYISVQFLSKCSMESEEKIDIAFMSGSYNKFLTNVSQFPFYIHFLLSSAVASFFFGNKFVPKRPDYFTYTNSLLKLKVLAENRHEFVCGCRWRIVHRVVAEHGPAVKMGRTVALMRFLYRILRQSGCKLDCVCVSVCVRFRKITDTV